MEEMYMNIAITIILQKVKDEKFKAKFKSALLKVKKAIEMAFPGE